jgi:hypothetical protein
MLLFYFVDKYEKSNSTSCVPKMAFTRLNFEKKIVIYYRKYQYIIIRWTHRITNKTAKFI